MKKNFKCLALMAAALLVGFSSCSNDNDNLGDGDKGQKHDAYLKINKAVTRAEGSAQGAAEVVFTTGDVYFADAQGNIKRHLTISSDPTTTTNLNLADLTKKGETVKNLPESATKVYMVGNTPGLPKAGNISTVKAKVLNVEDQKTITNVNLYGEATATEDAPATDKVNAKYKVEITLNPTVARVELTDMKITGNVITSYEIAGIFIDNYYAQAAADGTVDKANLKDNGTKVEAFGGTTGATDEYPATLNPSIFDWYATPLAASADNVAKPAKEVWGYNVFATTTAAAYQSVAPRIVIRLTNIKTTKESGVTYTEDQFVTIKGLKEGTSDAMATIEAGKIYNIAKGALVIDETALTPTPNLKAIDVTVTVKLASWVPVSINPEI